MTREVKYTLRIPEDIHQKLEASAAKNRRSLNNEMLIILEKFLEEFDKKGALDSNTIPPNLYTNATK